LYKEPLHVRFFLVSRGRICLSNVTQKKAGHPTCIGGLCSKW
jgi:hypothetical protein